MPIPQTLQIVSELLTVPLDELSEELVAERIGAAVTELLPGTATSIVAGRSDPGTGDWVAALPLEATGGVLRVSGGGPLGDEDLAALRAIAGMAGATLANLRRFDKLRSSTERTRLEALHDPLTGLPNRVLLLDRLDHAVARAARTASVMAVLFVDLDRFKRVNDLFGHAVGDELLVAVAGRLQAFLRRGDTAGRMAGDEFVVLCEDLRDHHEAAQIAGRLRSALDEPFILPAAVINVTASVGIAFAGDADHVPARVLEDADAAMYQAKRRGGAQHRVLDPGERQDTRRRARLERELPGAATRCELAPVYQPIVRTVDGRIVGVEALLRWSHPDLGEIEPGEFIPVAEESSLIAELGIWVLQRACEDRRVWAGAAGSAELDLAVNVSPRQLLSREFPATVAAVLEATGTDPASVTLEITEEVFMSDPERARLVLEDLKTRGLQLALDDFGTGYSSLSCLKQFPFDVVKIDKHFVSDLDRDPASHAIVYAVAELAHILGMTVVAEGVETLGQRHMATMLGCDYSQGWFFSRARSPDGVAELLAEHREEIDLRH